ncbi:MAG: hypothetical protein ACOZF0_19365 [Thermodesulfobacteriota bacterium]
MKIRRNGIWYLLPLFLMACGAGYGTIRPDLETARLFEDCRILPDHRYYYSGPEARPDAIIGIRKEYTLRTTMWKQVEPTPELLKRWLNNMLPAIGYSFANFGSVILDPSGKKVGVWYSLVDRTVVQFPEPGVIIVYKPPSRTDYESGRHFRYPPE